MDQATFIFDQWRGFNGENDFFIKPAPQSVFQEYYMQLFQHYSSPDMLKKSVLKKNADVVRKIASVDFAAQDPAENAVFWSMVQVFFAQLRSKNSEWEIPSEFANALACFWNVNHREHERFRYALLLDNDSSIPDSPEKITDRQVIAFEQKYAAKDVKIAHDLTLWFFRRKKHILVCPVCGEPKSAVGMCPVCKSNPLSAGLRLCRGCRRPLNSSANFICYGTKNVACRVCKKKLAGE